MTDGRSILSARLAAVVLPPHRLVVPVGDTGAGIARVPAQLRVPGDLLVGQDVDRPQMTRQMHDTRLRGVGARLDAWLALGDGALPPRGEWRALADELGVSPEALYRELARRRASAVLAGDGADRGDFP